MWQKQPNLRLFKFISFNPRTNANPEKRLKFFHNPTSGDKNLVVGEVKWRRKGLPALQEVGGSFCKSLSSLRMRFEAMGGTIRIQIWKGKRDLDIRFWLCSTKNHNQWKRDLKGKEGKSESERSLWLSLMESERASEGEQMFKLSRGRYKN